MDRRHILRYVESDLREDYTLQIKVTFVGNSKVLDDRTVKDGENRVMTGDIRL